MRARKIVSQVMDFGASFGTDLHFDQSQVTGHRRLMRDILHIDHVDQLVQIRFDLVRIHIAVGTIHHDGHARDIGIFRPPDRQRLDIEIAAAEQGRHAVQTRRVCFQLMR